MRFTVHFAAGLGILCAMPLLRRRANRMAAWWYRRLLRVLGIRVQLRGRLPDGGTLAACNHVSWLDIIVLGGVVDAAFVSKAEVAQWPLAGRFARYTGTVFLPRGAGRTRAATAALTAAMAAGHTVVLFPEATTNATLEPRRFHARLFAAAIETATPVQPVAIHYLPDDGAHGHHRLAPWVDDAGLGAHFRELFALAELTVRVVFCPPEPSTGQARRALANACHAAITKALDPPA